MDSDIYRCVFKCLGIVLRCDVSSFMKCLMGIELRGVVCSLYESINNGYE